MEFRAAGMGMSVVAPGGAQTRRLASLLGGTALVSVAALSMAVTERARPAR